MARSIPFRGQGHVYVQMDLACGHQGSSEAARDGLSPVRLAAWCVECQTVQPRRSICTCVLAPAHGPYCPVAGP